ncbi:hypothetical protein EUGRSUZ_H04395 [Eucalyptus grandis]|uniref:Uncharacterized protein n=2 Tax=Eucalyptus grandis TaxID=71139 RepID=A0ACC3JWW3_EUCGR|nr:hypothetical protein EUGRSUZ_H04395 [Eucalyptus grandis]
MLLAYATVATGEITATHPAPQKRRRKRKELAANSVTSKVLLHRVPKTAKTSQRGEKINPCTHLDFRHSGLHFQLAQHHTPGSLKGSNKSQTNAGVTAGDFDKDGLQSPYIHQKPFSKIRRLNIGNSDRINVQNSAFRPM